MTFTANGLTFHHAASTTADAASHRGRHCRTPKTSTQIGKAANRSRVMFSPSGPGIANATAHAARKTANTHGRGCARRTRHVEAAPRTANAHAAANSLLENGYPPPAGKSRHRSAATRPTDTNAPPGATLR